MASVDASPVFVGRDAELGILDRGLGRAEEGHTSVVLIGGEAGVGKTRLIREFVGSVRGRVLVVEGHCFPARGHAPPYGPFAGLFRDLGRQVPRADLDVILGPAGRELGRILVEPRRAHAPVSPGVSLESRAASRLRTFELVLGVAERLQRTRAAVIVVEDLHWADQASLDLLGFLARNVQQARILLVLTVRTDEARMDTRVVAAVGELGRTGLVERIELQRLSPSEAAAQIAGILRARPEPGLVDRVLSRSDGNPLFTEELLAADQRGERRSVPPLLQDLLRSRLATISETTRSVLRTAAVAGIEIDDELVAAASGLAPDVVAGALRQANERGLLARSDSPSGGYVFRHHLLQQAIEGELLPGERRSLHAGCAQALERAVGREPETGEIARHWQSAERPDRAFPAAVTAGLDAESRYAFADARRFYDLALSLLDRFPPDAAPSIADVLNLLGHAADAAALSGDPSGAVFLARRALTLVRPGSVAQEQAGRWVDRTWPEDPGALAATFLERLVWYLWQAGDYDGAQAVLEEAYRLLPGGPPTTLRARVLGHLGGLYLQRGRLEDALSSAGQAIDAARATGALPELALALGVRGWCRTTFGEPDDGIGDMREGLAIAELLGQPEGRALAVSNLASLLLYAGRLDDAEQTALSALEDVRSAGLERTYGGALEATAAAAAFARGRWEHAQELCRRALDIAPPQAVALWPAAVAMRLAVATGDAELGQAARRMAETGLTVTPERVALEWERVATIEAALADGDLAHAEELAAAAIDALPGNALDEPAGCSFALGIRVAADRAEIAHAAGEAAECAGQRSRAATLHDEWRRRREAFGARVPDAPTLTAIDALCDAEAARAAGDCDPAAWERAARSHEGLGRPYQAAYARYHQAEAILLASPRRSPGATREARSGAAATLVETLRIARELPAGPLVTTALALARRARLDVVESGTIRAPARPDETPDPVAGDRAATFAARRGLTQREVEVLALVAAGWSNSEIAGALYISRKTASVHVSNILGKLEVGDRVGAAVLAQRAGLIGPPPPGSSDADAEN